MSHTHFPRRQVVRRSLSLLTTFLVCLLVVPAALADKLVVPTGFDTQRIADASLIADYGSYQLLEAPGPVAAAAEQAYSAQGVRRLPNADWLFFEAHPFNTQINPPPSGPQAAGAALHLVQFAGPIRQDWLDAVRAAGAVPVHYIANHGYLVWADAPARLNLDALAAAGEFVQFSAPYQGLFKLGPSLRARTGLKSAGDALVPVVVQIYRHADNAATKNIISGLSRSQLAPWTPILDYENAKFEISTADLAEITARPDVYWVGEVLPRELHDEVQTQIMAGDFNADMSGPSAPGYLAFLNGLGFPDDQSEYPVVDVVDDGIGDGTVTPGDPTFHEQGNLANPTRLQFVSNCTNSASGEGVDGHGHINASIAGGHDTRAGFPFQDPNLFQRGLGINPFGPMAGTRIFDPGFDQSSCGNSDTGVIQHT